MSCCVCQKTKTTLTCGLCSQDVCKSCTVFLDDDSFAYLEKRPADLSHGAYCSSCFSMSVDPELSKYNETLERARDILVFEKSQGKETRLLSRKEAVLSIADMTDKDEAVLRLAFMSAARGFNAIIDVDLKPKKVYNGRHQHTLWSATAMPANVSDRKLVKDRSIWSNPN